MVNVVLRVVVRVVVHVVVGVVVVEDVDVGVLESVEVWEDVIEVDGVGRGVGVDVGANVVGRDVGALVGIPVVGENVGGVGGGRCIHRHRQVLRSKR